MELEEIAFSTPCTVPWESMTGGGNRVRFCGTCQRQVVNLSSMTRAQAQAFLDETFGTSCVQLWKREDGTVVTTDCGRRPSPQARPLAGAPMNLR